MNHRFEAVFISDLHLNPEDAAITTRFEAFIDWAALHTKAVYILGDFFHVWPGDEALDEWSKAIAKRLAGLSTQGISLYLMTGNRDFLLGPRFLQLAQAHVLTEPSIIQLGDEKVLLVHGDRYCTNDKGHQWLRWLTRNRFFIGLFLRLPFAVRRKIVNQVRQHSQKQRAKSYEQWAIVPTALCQHLRQLQLTTVIHGHIHRPGLTMHRDQYGQYHQFVLSDWDDKPMLLCYDHTKGYEFIQI